MTFSVTKKAIIALILANIIWGATPPLMKWALTDVPTFTLAFLRYLIPSILLGIIAFKRLRIDKRDIPKIIVAAVTGTTLNIGLYFIGMHYTQSINVTVIASASPVFLLIGCMLFLNERPSKKTLLGNLMGLSGVLLIVIEPILVMQASKSFIGNLLLVGSAIASIVNTLIAKELVGKYSAMTLTFWTFFIGAISFLPLAGYEQLTQGLFITHLTLSGVVGIIYGSFFASFLAWLLFYYGLRRVLASETGVFMYIDPIATLIVAIPLLHEFPTPLFILGSLFVFFGIYIAEGRLHWHPLHRLLK